MIVIVDYGMGNLGSVLNMLKKLNQNAVISSDVELIKSAQKLILPGVGNFQKAMQNLNDLNLISILNQKVLVEKTPVLGICLGMQLMTKRSDEGNVSGLGWIDAETIKFNLDNYPSLKAPHMGWNNVDFKGRHSISETLENSRFYFVHSYFVKCTNINNVLSTTNYGEEFHSGIFLDNIYGVQFHPEKSHKFGFKLFTNFCNL
jgi:glutamine amidotransferase